MKEKIIENGIEYVKSGDYYIPNLKAPEGTYNIGRYGKLHSIFIKENRPTFYSMKMLNGTWLAYLEEIDTSAKEMVDRLIKDMAVEQGITEELKVKDQMAWDMPMQELNQIAYFSMLGSADIQTVIAMVNLLTSQILQYGNTGICTYDLIFIQIILKKSEVLSLP